MPLDLAGDLAELIADFRAELDLENIAGTTVDDLQGDIESNLMPTEWSNVRQLLLG